MTSFTRQLPVSEPTDRSALLAVDIGGTFTDVVVAAPGGRLVSGKYLSTPHDPAEGVVRGAIDVLARAGVDPAQVGRVAHATTLATNLILERRGVRVAFVTTEGFRSMLTLGRSARVEEQRYDLFFDPPEAPVPASHCFEVAERVLAGGTVVKALADDDAGRVAAAIARLGVEAVAVCFLHSYANPSNEQRMVAHLREQLPNATIVSSATTWPELREYERAATTVMSAYVGPVMARYLAGLSSRLAEIGVDAPVHIMESSGGVMPLSTAAARPVCTIESGPAAGVVAVQQIGAALGIGDLVSFDMGGTTAKAGVVRRGRADVTHQFQLGGAGSFGGRREGTGIPIKIPAVDLAEVGAGGGSVAWLDPGGALRVGPRSAGAVPGPACYGRGGQEPTVTDADVVLGFLDAAQFAGGTLPLYPELAAAAIRRHLAGPLGVGVEEAAFAVHEMANASTGSAVHVATVQRGIDPRRFTLVALGGAGPVHAAGIAERFGIGRVVIPAEAGVGSAVGLLGTDLSAERSRTSVMAAEGADCERIAGILEELTDAGVTDVGAGRDEVEVRTAVDMRYVGQAHELTVDAPALPVGPAWLAEVEAGFRARYAEVYGSAHAGAVELVSFRARVVRRVPASASVADHGSPLSGRLEERALRGVRPTWSAGDTGGAGGRDEAGGARAAGDMDRTPGAGEAGGARAAGGTTGAGFVSTPVYDRARLALGDRIGGPAIVEEPDATVVVPRGWEACVGAASSLVLQRQPGDVEQQAPGTRALRSSRHSPPELSAEILRHALVVAAEEASIVVVRAAYSTFIVEGSDASAAIFDAAGRLVAQSTATSLAHTASLRLCLGAVLEDIPLSSMEPDDVYVMNDSYRGGIHANDLAFLQPVFVDGSVRYVTGTLIHVSDVGGSSAGGMHATATDIFQEGLQLPPVKMADTGGLRDDIARIIALNSRTPDAVLGDIRALIAGTTVARRRLEALAEEHGADGLSAGVEDFQAYAERLVRRELATFPPGTYRGSYVIDNDGIDLQRSHRVEVAVTVEGERAVVDFTGTSSQVAAAINCSMSQTLSGAAYALRCFLEPDIPMNEGFLAPFEFRVPLGSLLQPEAPGTHRRPVRRASTPSSTPSSRALSQARPERAVAASGILTPFTIAAPATVPVHWAHMAYDFGGVGARRGKDGPNATGLHFGIGRNTIPQAEPVELRCPLVVEGVELIADSGGPGRWRGGAGSRTTFLVHEDAVVTMRCDRYRFPPPGVDGGHPGRPGSYYVV